MPMGKQIAQRLRGGGPMTKRHELRCYDYVNHPYDRVREALLRDPLGIFERATRSAAARANAIGAELHVRVGAIDLAADVTIHIDKVTEARSPDDKPAMQVAFSWRAERRPGLFPSMTGTIAAYALSPRETQLELVGTYDPPLGIVGEAIDAVAMHRIAEASVQRFISDVSAFLRRELPAQPGPGDTFMFAATD